MASALSIWAAARSLKLSKLPRSVLPSSAMLPLSGCCACRLKLGGMLAEDNLDLRGIKTLEDIPDRSVSGCAAPLQTEDRIQPAAMHIDEGDDASIRVAVGHDGRDGEQKHVGKLVPLPLPAAGIGNVRQQVQQRCECGHANLRLGCRPRTSVDS